MKATKAELKRAFMAGSSHERDYVNEKHMDSPHEGFQRWFAKLKNRKKKK